MVTYNNAVQLIADTGDKNLIWESDLEKYNIVGFIADLFNKPLGIVARDVLLIKVNAYSPEPSITVFSTLGADGIWHYANRGKGVPICSAVSASTVAYGPPSRREYPDAKLCAKCKRMAIG